MSKSVFISYSTDDTAVAEQIRDGLESAGITCWMAPRDIAPGKEYPEQILDAIEACQVLLVVVSESSNVSRFVRNEVERAVAKDKTIVPVRIHDVPLSRSLEFLISTSQWVDAVGKIESAIAALQTALAPYTKPASDSMDGQSVDNDLLTEAGHNLPVPSTPFVGREQELAELANLLDNSEDRLITIVGPGGMGKTRLALEAASRHWRSQHQTVTLVELAPLNDAADMVDAIAGALGYTLGQSGDSPRQELLRALSRQTMLLVLDNFEHLLEGAELVADILRTAPGVRVLATSRERLQLNGEVIFALGGMEFPEWEIPEDAAEYTAVKLFLQSAQRARRGYTLRTDNLSYVSRICRLVEGLPLAILLAASWVEMLSTQEIAEEVERSLDFLESEMRDLPERQRSIRAVFDYSWRLLSQAQQSAFAKISVFRGGMTRQAAQAVTGVGLRDLNALHNKSLIARSADGRYEIHELMRQYGEEKLRESGQMMSVENSHAGFYLDLLHEREADLKGRNQLGALVELDADFENIRVAWRWAGQQRDYMSIDRALESVYWYCIMRSRLTKGQDLLRLAQAQLAPEPGAEPHPVWGRVMARAMKINILYLEPVEDVRARVKTALALAESRDDRREIAFCHWALGMAYLHVKDAAQAVPHFERSLEEFQAIGDRFYIAFLLYYLGQTRVLALLPEGGNLDRSLELRRELGDRSGVAYSLHEIGVTLYFAGERQASRSYLEEAYEIHREMGNRQGMCENLPILSLFPLIEGDLPRARTLAHEMKTIALETNSPRHQGIAEVRLGIAAFVEGDLDRSRHHFEEALRVISGADQHVVAGAELGLSKIASVQGDWQEAKRHFRIATAHSTTGFPVDLRPAEHLAQAALIAEHEGKIDVAVLLLSHASTRLPFYGAGPHFVQLRTDLESAMAPSDFAAAWERGQSLQFKTILNELLAEVVD